MLKLRLYQEEIVYKSLRENTLVILPTGLGKTIIALALAKIRLKKFPNSKILMLAPTKPLCEQHKKTFEEYELKGVVITGEISPKKRKEIYEKNKIIFATPQTIENDIIRDYINLEEFSLIIFDEAHRAVGNYSYVYIAKEYNKKGKNKLILGLTASPGDTIEKILEVCKNLFITNIEAKWEDDPSVKPYIKKKKIKVIEVYFPESLKEVERLLRIVLKRRLERLKELGYIEKISEIKKKDLIELQGKVEGEALSLVAGAIKVLYAIELLESQGVKPLYEYFKRLEEQKSRAKRDLMEEIEFRTAIIKTYYLMEKRIEHPKFVKLAEILRKELKEDKRIIIFSQYRATVDRIYEIIKEIENVRPVKFIGQKGGLKQKEQIEILNKFNSGEYNVLIATSIGEEGLHIESVDLGIFFEPVPSALRMIQRKGRIGRVKFGKIYILHTKGTIDEKMYWVSYYKEKRMRKAVEEAKRILEKLKNKQKSLLDYANNT